MFPPKRRLSVQLSRHANFMAFLLLWPNKIPISPRSRMLTFNFNAFLTNICVGRLWNMAIYGNRLYFTVPFYTHFLFESGPFRVLSYFFAFVFIVGWECFVKNFSTRRWYPLHSVWAELLLFRLLRVNFEHSYSSHPNWDIFILYIITIAIISSFHSGPQFNVRVVVISIDLFQTLTGKYRL